jgi:chemotaxis protein MotB
MSKPFHRARGGQERWLVSYADFITLLFGFFVVLYAFARADQKKQVAVSAAIDTAFNSMGVFTGGTQRSTAGSREGGSPGMPMNAVMGEVVLSPAKVRDDLDRIRQELERTLSGQIAQHTVSIHMGRDGLVISLREAGFFNSGSAEPQAGTLPALHQIADSLGRTPYDLRIEGHTDNIPIHNGNFDSNWELSSARATRIARVFLELKAVPPERLSAAGYAEFHPLVSNATAEGRSKNRRVDLVILPRSRVDLSVSGNPRLNGVWRKITDDPLAEER